MNGPMLDPVLAIVLRIALAGLLATAALHKLRHPRAFRSALEGYRMLPAGLVTPMARLLAPIEGATALLLLVRPVLGGAAAALLLACYAAMMIASLLGGEAGVDCGCGGPGGSMPVQWGLVARNGVLIGAALATMLPTSSRALVAVDVVTVLAGVVALALVHAGAETALATWARVRELRAPEEVPA